MADFASDLTFRLGRFARLAMRSGPRARGVVVGSLMIFARTCRASRFGAWISLVGTHRSKDRRDRAARRASSARRQDHISAALSDAIACQTSVCPCGGRDIPGPASAGELAVHPERRCRGIKSRAGKVATDAYCRSLRLTTHGTDAESVRGVAEKGTRGTMAWAGPGPGSEMRLSGAPTSNLRCGSEQYFAQRLRWTASDRLLLADSRSKKSLRHMSSKRGQERRKRSYGWGTQHTMVTVEPDETGRQGYGALC